MVMTTKITVSLSGHSSYFTLISGGTSLPASLGNLLRQAQAQCAGTPAPPLSPAASSRHVHEVPGGRVGGRVKQQ